MLLEHAGNSNYYFDRIAMKRTTQPQNWLNGKYGEAVHLWYCDMKIYYNSTQCTQYGQFDKGTNIFFDYKYVKRTVTLDQENYVLEAYQNRHFYVNNPDDYRGIIKSD